MEKLDIRLNSNNDIKIQIIAEDKDVTDLKKQHKKLFTENHTGKGIKVTVEPKLGARLIHQKSRPIPIHLQPAVKKENDKLMKVQRKAKEAVRKDPVHFLERKVKKEASKVRTTKTPSLQYGEQIVP